MIPISVPGWQKELADSVTDPAELIAILDLDPTLLPAARQAARLFRLKVPRAFIARMRRGDPKDPLLRQVLPLGEECLEVAGYTNDPLREIQNEHSDGVLHKYEGRALVITTGVCGIHCRYCFRRHFPYSEFRPSADGWAGVIERFRSNPGLDEAILSGGDPLSMSDTKLAQLVEGLDSVPHLQRLRIHTRQPIVIPSRVDERLLRWLSATRLTTVMVVHVNHSAEIDGQVRTAMKALRETGITLLNQSVLLRGVNDDETALVELSEALFEAGVLPYYLHALDPVAGAAHFDVPEARALALHSSVQGRLPGYLVPRLVREIPGRPSKTSILATDDGQ